jgi:hypothetical protein
MWMLVNWVMLVLATLIAGAAAVAFYWLLLRATVAMMRPAVLRPATVRPAALRPATVRPAPVRTELARGTADLLHAFTPRRSAQPQERNK